MLSSRTIPTRLRVLLTLAIAAVAALAISGTASAKDRNHDRIPDKWEKRHKLSLKVNQARRDQDHDRLRNLAEFKAGTNPRKADSDGDGIPDGEENAGTIASFDPQTGKLTINLFNGETISGFVTEETEIECGCGRAAGEEQTGTARASSESAGESSGSADDEPGQEAGDDEAEGSDDVGDAEDGGSCTTEDLVEGATVREADLHLANGVATFEKVELGRNG